MLYYIYKHIIFQRVIIALLLLLECLIFIYRPEMSPSQTHAPLYTLLYNLLQNHPIALTALFLLTLAGQLLQIYNYTQNSSLKVPRSQMSIFWFALFLLITNVAYPLSPMFFINFIALLILNINSRKQEDIKRSFYISGFLVGIASLIETSATILLLFVLVMALIKEYTKFKELIITFLGMFTVYLYLFAIYFYMDNMRGFVQFFDPQNWICPYLQVLDYSILQFIFLLFIILLISYICIFFAIRLRNKTIQVRKKAGCFHIFTLTMFFVSGMNFYYLVEVMIISFSIYYAIFSRYTKGRIAYDIMLFLFVLILLFIKVWA